MKAVDDLHPPPQLAGLRMQLKSWLAGAGYPRWAQNGIDPRTGGFVEALSQGGHALAQPRRARIHPRQIYAFAQAHAAGWGGDAAGIVRRGMDYFTTYYRRPDGLFRTLAAVDGAPLDERAVLYDQAFALLGYAAAATALDARDEYEQRALALRGAIELRFRRHDGAFRSAESADGFLESNPHMHLLEACLAWAEIGSDPRWQEWSANLVELALARFIHPGSGALGESFTADWLPAPGTAGRIVEPGHQFEWAWLLLRSESDPAGRARAAALRLIAIGERFGVYNRVAVNALLDDFSIHDTNARCWPQTERLKAGLLAAQRTGEDRYWSMACAAATSLLPYLDTPVAGLWLDLQLPSGELVDSASPASTFYHLVGAIMALDKLIEQSAPLERADGHR